MVKELNHIPMAVDLADIGKMAVFTAKVFTHLRAAMYSKESGLMEKFKDLAFATSIISIR